MKKVVKSHAIPNNSSILNGFGKADYQDSYSIQKDTDKTAEEISKELMKLPNWVEFLFILRHKIAKIFGLKTDKNTSKQNTFFPLIEKNENEIIMGETDKHLDFRASITKNRDKNIISLITVVHFNNIWGKVYFLPVKPFHGIIVKILMKNYLKI